MQLQWGLEQWENKPVFLDWAGQEASRDVWGFLFIYLFIYLFILLFNSPFVFAPLRAESS
jgi:hypothetical protein